VSGEVHAEQIVSAPSISPSISVSQGPTYPPGHPDFEGGPSDAEAQKAREEESSPGTNSSESSETPKKTRGIPRR
jgi:hypothetical protein